MSDEKIDLGTGTQNDGGLSETRDNTKDAPYWVSHRMGPFMVHRVGICTPEPNDNPGYGDDLDHLLLQGFWPCPKCTPDRTD